MGQKLIAGHSYGDVDCGRQFGHHPDTQVALALPAYPPLQLIPQHQRLSERRSRYKLSMVPCISGPREKEEAHLTRESRNRRFC